MFRSLPSRLRWRDTIAALLALAALGGCQSFDSDEDKLVIPPDLGLDHLMALPQPFKPLNKTSPLLRPEVNRADVAMPPVDGLSDSENLTLSNAIVRAADGHDILVVTQVPDRTIRLLEGIAERSPSELRINWFLRNGYGELVRKFEVSLPVLPGVAEPLNTAGAGTLAQQTVAQLAATLVRTGALREAASGASTANPPKVFIGAVTGAPGNGARVLPVTLKAILDEDGLPLAADASSADFTLEAAVTQGPAKNDTEPFSITWRLIDPKGASAGEISQTNQIKAGSLDGDWGATAFDIARGAEQGLFQMLAEIQARRDQALGIDETDAPGPAIPNSVLHPRGD